MAILELSTAELAKTAAAFTSGELSNIKGLSNGISFNAELGIKLFPKLIPLKMVFYEFDEPNGIIIFEILLNNNSKILNKGFGLIVNAFGSLLIKDYLPEGVKLEDNYLYITPSKMLQQTAIEISIKGVKIKTKKIQINFEVDSE